MKKVALLFASLLIGLTTASAKELNNKITNNHINKTKHYSNAEPIVFIENGVKFLIFPDGSFNYKNITTYNNKRKNIKSKYVINTSRDRNGKINRIGHVNLNYDRYGKITRVGSVNIDYNRNNGILTRVGGLHINYNHKGKIPNSKGKIHNNYTRRR